MCRLDTSSVHLKTGTMKRITILSGLLTVALIFIACNDDTPDGTSGDNSNQNANPTVIQNARNLEMPRLDDQTGDIYSHYVTYRGEQVLNYTLDWHKEKKHSRWVAFVFTNTTSGTSWNRNNWKGTEWNGKVWEGDPFQPDPDIPAGERNELSDFSRSGYQSGHLCASADRLFSMDANGQTFYLSNMSPQMGSFNSPNWSDLETQVRNWGRNNNFRDTLFVVKGGTIRPNHRIHRWKRPQFPHESRRTEVLLHGFALQKVRRRTKHLQSHRFLGGTQTIRHDSITPHVGRQHRRTGREDRYRFLLQSARPDRNTGRTDL